MILNKTDWAGKINHLLSVADLGEQRGKCPRCWAWGTETQCTYTPPARPPPLPCALEGRSTRKPLRGAARGQEKVQGFGIGGRDSRLGVCSLAQPTPGTPLSTIHGLFKTIRKGLTELESLVAIIWISLLHICTVFISHSNEFSSFEVQIGQICYSSNVMWKNIEPRWNSTLKWLSIDLSNNDIVIKIIVK